MRRIFAFEGDGRVTQYEGGFTDYQAAYEAKNPEGMEAKDGVLKKAENGEKKKQEKPKSERKLKFSFKEQKEWDTIEDEIGALEEALEGLEVLMAEAARDYSKLNALMKEKTEKEQLLEEKMERWMYLNELAEQIKNQ